MAFETSVVGGNLNVRGNLTAASMTIPNNTISDASVDADANIDADKLQHRHAVSYNVAHGTSVSAETRTIHIAANSGVVSTIVASVTAAPTGTRTATIDLQKSTAGGAFATVLNSVITINSSTTIRTAIDGTLGTATYTDDDIFALVIATPAGSGSLPQGLSVTVNFDEDSD